MAEIWFPDLSDYNTVDIQPDTVVVVARATIGNARDSRYETYKTQAAQRGAFFVAYHFLNATGVGTGTAQEQADLAFSVVGPNIPLMLDVERNLGGSATVDDAVRFIDRYRSHGGIVNFVYIPRWYWQSLGGPSMQPLVDRHMHLVSSSYTSLSDGDGWKPYGGRTPEVWQYTDSFNYGGGAVDFNWFKGSLDQYKALAWGGAQPANPPTAAHPAKVVLSEWVTLNATDQLLVKILSYYPKVHEIEVTSGTDGDHGPSSYHYGGTYRGSPMGAIDLGGGATGGSVHMRDCAKWLYDNFSRYIVELIHTTPFSDDQGFYVKNGTRHPGGGPYDAATRDAHRDHIHFATSTALASQILAELATTLGDDEDMFYQEFEMPGGVTQLNVAAPPVNAGAVPWGPAWLSVCNDVFGGKYAVRIYTLVPGGGWTAITGKGGTAATTGTKNVNFLAGHEDDTTVLGSGELLNVSLPTGTRLISVVRHPVDANDTMTQSIGGGVEYARRA